MTFHRWAYSNDTEHCQTDKFGALGVISDRGGGGILSIKTNYFKKVQLKIFISSDLTEFRL